MSGMRSPACSASRLRNHLRVSSETPFLRSYVSNADSRRAWIRGRPSPRARASTSASVGSRNKSAVRISGPSTPEDAEPEQEVAPPAPVVRVRDQEHGPPLAFPLQETERATPRPGRQPPDRSRFRFHGRRVGLRGCAHESVVGRFRRGRTVSVWCGTQKATARRRSPFPYSCPSWRPGRSVSSDAASVESPSQGRPDPAHPALW